MEGGTDDEEKRSELRLLDINDHKKAIPFNTDLNEITKPDLD